MSKHQEWKMVHMLYRYGRLTPDGRRVLNERELRSAGVHCGPDTHQVMVDAKIVTQVGDEYELSEPARNLLRAFTLSKSPHNAVDVRIDYPEAFVVMPFSEGWSSNVFDQMLKPGIEGAGFDVTRGDSIVRIGDLSTNVWQQITQAGVIVADVTAPNPNVYYEIGLADALGKPVFLFKQESVRLPADFGGEHYYEYSLDDLDAGRSQLVEALKQWADHEDHQPFGVKALVESL